MKKKLMLALAAYVVLAVLAWSTLDASIPIGSHDVPLRAVTLAVLALFAVRTLLHSQRERMEQSRDSEREVADR